MTTIYFIRHGEVHNPEHILYLRIPGFKISENGHKQAAAAGDFLADRPLAAIFSSPQQRAQETAQHIAKHHALDILTEEKINEVYSPWQGKSFTEAMANNFDLYTGNEPPYERLQDVFERTMAFIEQVKQGYHGQHVAAITHGDIVKMLFMHVYQIPMNPDAKHHVPIPELTEYNYPATASITQLVFTADGELPTLTYTKPY